MEKCKKECMRNPKKNNEETIRTGETFEYGNKYMTDITHFNTHKI